MLSVGELFQIMANSEWTDLEKKKGTSVCFP